MTTVIYTKGRVYSDTCSTTLVEGKPVEQEKTKKIFRIGDRIFSGAGYLRILEILRKPIPRVFLGTFGFYPIILDSKNNPFSSADDTTTLMVVSEKHITIRRVKCVHINSWLMFIKPVKTIFFDDISKTEISFGSGQEYAFSRIDRGRCPINAIKFASKYDYYTNDDVIWQIVPPSSAWTDLLYKTDKIFYTLKNKFINHFKNLF